MDALVDRVNALTDAIGIVHDNQIDQNRSVAGLRQELRDMREELDAVRKELARYGKADKPSRSPKQRC